jgi:asparagine synthetase B (glutamine-hydrolysing)
MCGIQLHAWSINASSCPHCRRRKAAADAVDSRNDNGSASSMLHRRGPDHVETIQRRIQHYDVDLSASVLQMRQVLQTQPVDIQGNAFLCWNGEVYQRKCDNNNGNGLSADDNIWNYQVSDTTLVAKLLKERMIKEKCGNDDLATTQRQVAHIMASLYNGEFAFVILNLDSGVLFGRDVWGRRSLLLRNCSHCGSFQISSVMEEAKEEDIDDGSMEWKELPPGEIHAFSFSDTGLSILPPLDFATMVTIPQTSIELPTLLLPPPDNINVSPNMWQASFQLEEYLRQAVQMRIGGHDSVGVLFSGGVDSVVIAALAAEQLLVSSTPTNATSLHLYNVSFGNIESSADRQAALISYQALRDKHTDLSIQFHDIQITNWDQVCVIEGHVRALLQPKTPTVMDINIATALWFAARGSSRVDDKIDCNDSNNHAPRILLLGMGADELLGGYGRHRKAYQHGGFDLLEAELQMDQDRLWDRNLGRDDRLVADHGKEARFPFLDAHVVNFLRNQPLKNICNLDLPPGQGDKQVLRLIAQRLGMDHASGLVKRAIQFGSRISHLSDKQRFGSRRKAKGESRV